MKGLSRKTGPFVLSRSVGDTSSEEEKIRRERFERCAATARRQQDARHKPPHRLRAARPSDGLLCAVTVKCRPDAQRHQAYHTAGWQSALSGLQGTCFLSNHRK
ncbi:hypothetical protein KCP78_20170 [Salmonella enterica subsp. enterica]|nr:hypothetical protein KCP78_20170 [Salmonella enterica subsp. enterica]